LNSISGLFCNPEEQDCNFGSTIADSLNADKTGPGTVSALDLAVGSIASLFTPEVSDILNNVAKDTGFSGPPSDDGVNSGESTEEVALSVDNLFAGVDMFIPEENKALNNFWGAFKKGLSNSGDQRKGKRDSSKDQ